MARKTKTVTITFEGRDKGKKYLLTEMPASRAEKWAARGILALAHAGIEVPEEISGLGMAALAVVGLRALGRVSFAEAEPLMDEMMECIQAIPDPGKPAIIRLLVEDDIEEVATRAYLRSEVFELHVGFSIAGAIWGSEPARQKAEETPLPAMQTFRRRSVQ